mmetsp:Transcript_15989/g.35984  ORF Transcript_15989/g.35984 Transcript_15989/m.35984 type:complete len:101 (-) Transcript_15989:631-933(-)
MARLSILFLLAIPSGSVAFAPQPFSRPVTKCSNVKRQMFSGSGGGADSLDEAEDAAKVCLPLNGISGPYAHFTGWHISLKLMLSYSNFIWLTLLSPIINF